jgi:hypothetical protein
MDDQGHPQTPYPPEATGAERKMLELMAATGLLLISALVVAMSIGMYLLPNAPPLLPQPLVF